MNLSLAIYLTTLMLSFSLSGTSQKKVLTFDVVRNEKTLGKIIFSQTSSGKTDSLNMECKVNAKFVGAVTAEVRETAVFSDGVLVQSSIYRKMNGNEKANKSQRVTTGKYVVANGKKSKEINIYPITYSMLSLYSYEPLNISQVYSDNFEAMVPVKRIQNHQYIVTLPDKSYNYYLYTDGTLTEVVIHHTLYSAKFVLTGREINGSY